MPDRRWDLLLVCLAVYVLTTIGRVHQLFAFLLPLKPALVSGGLTIVLFLLDRSRERRLAPVWAARTTKCVVGLLVLMALSVPGALWPGNSFELLTDAFVKTVTMYVVMVAATRGLRDVQRLSLVYFFGAATYAAVVLTRFQLTDASWRLGNLYYYDANDFATLAVTTMPLGLYLLTTRQSLALRLAVLPGLAVLGVVFVRSGSRGGFLALLTVTLFFLLRYTAVRARWRVVGTAVLATLLVAVASDRYWEQMHTIVKADEDYNRTSETGRIHIWQRGIGYMLRHPLLGVGAGNFPVAEGTISSLATRQTWGKGVRWSAPHNTYVQVGAELGVPGLLLFMAVLTYTFAALHRIQRSSGTVPGNGQGARPLAQSLTASLIGFTVGAFFLSLAYGEMLYTLAGLAIALHKVALPSPPRRGPRSRVPPPAHLLRQGQW